MNNHYSPFNLFKDNSVYAPTQTFNPKAIVTLEYGEDTYIGAIGFDDSVNNNGLIGFDFNLSEGEGGSSCKIDVFDEDRALANILFKYVDSIGGLTPVITKDEGGVSSIGSGCWLIPCNGINNNNSSGVGLFGDDRGTHKHKGTDIAGNDVGEPVYASKAGTISVKNANDGRAGNWIGIKHDGGYETRYLHLNSFSSINEGDTVEAGQQIGTVGNSGVDDVHLHFEVRKDGKAIDPATVLPDLGKSRQKVVAKTQVCANDSVSTNLSGEVSKDGKFNISKDESIALIVQTALDNGVTDKGQIAYMLATAQHESGNFVYSEEIDKPSGYEGGAQYYGRGYVQITHKAGYNKAGKKLGLDLVNNPQLATKPGVAASIVVLGMKEGWFANGRPISYYIEGDKQNFYDARDTINGDKHIIDEGYTENRGNVIANYAEDYLAKMDDLLAGKTTNSSSATSGVSANGATVASSTPNGGQITIEVYLDDPDLSKPRKAVYSFIHVGVDYAEDGRKVTIYGQSVAFKLAQKLVNTAYTDVTLHQIFTDFANRTNSELEMAEDGILYEYFPINGTSAWKSLVAEGKRRGYLVTAVNNKIKVQTLKEKKVEVLSDVSTSETDTDAPKTEEVDTSEVGDLNKLYVLRNGYNAGLDVLISHKAESHNGGISSDDSSSTNIDANAKAEIDPMTGSLDLTADGKLKGIKDGIYTEGSNVPKLKPIYKSTNNDNNDNNNSDNADNTSNSSSDVYNKYSSFVWITDSGEENSNGNALWKVEVISNKTVVGTFQSVSGRYDTQDLDKYSSGNKSPSPDGEYKIGASGVPDGNPELGGVFTPYEYLPKNNKVSKRENLGFHVDPSWNQVGNPEEGTSGCHAFDSLDTYNKFKTLITDNRIDTLIIQAGGSTTGDIKGAKDAALTDASNKDDLNRISGINLTASLPIDSKLLVLRPTDLIKTEGYGVDEFRTRIKRDTKEAKDYLDRMWLIKSISHNFYPNGYTTSLNCISPFRAKLETIKTEVIEEEAVENNE